MKANHFFLSALTAGIAAYAVYRQANKLKLAYNEDSNQLIIDSKYRMQLCREVVIESLVVRLNGEIYKGFDYEGDEKPFGHAIFIDLPELEAGDRIDVRMLTRCSRVVRKKGKLEIE
jgi:hypothetical protein